MEENQMDLSNDMLKLIGEPGNGSMGKGSGSPRTRLIKKYYNDRIYIDGMPTSDQLTEKDVDDLENTYGFAFYKLAEAADPVVTQIKTFVRLVMRDR